MTRVSATGCHRAAQLGSYGSESTMLTRGGWHPRQAAEIPGGAILTSQEHVNIGLPSQRDLLLSSQEVLASRSGTAKTLLCHCGSAH